MTARINVVAFASEDIQADANHLAMVLGQGPADGLTYGWVGWENADGRFAMRDFLVRPEWLEAAIGAPVRPAWDEGSEIDMDAAARAHAAIDLWLPPEEGEDPAAYPVPAPGRLVVFAGLDTRAAVAAAQVTPVDDPLD